MKRAVFFIFFSVSVLAVFGVFHYRQLPLYEWTRPLLAFPVIYAGVHFRRAGSILTAFILLLCQVPFLVMEAARAADHGITHFVAVSTTVALGVLIGHYLRRERENSAMLAEISKVSRSMTRGVTESELFSSLADLFREWAKCEMVEIYLLDAQGGLVRYDAPDSAPLPQDHLFYNVACDGEYFISSFIPEDNRLEYTGAPKEKDAVKRLAVFPLEFGGAIRGVAAVVNSGLARFSHEEISILKTIKKAVENALEAVEKRRSAVRHEMQRAKVRDMFSSYVSRAVAEEILKDPDKLELGGKLHDVAVLFTAVNNFPELAAKLPPKELVSLLNEYLSIVIDTLFEYNGTVDKYIEDSVMAFWGAPLPQPDCEERAVRCALTLRRRLMVMNEERDTRGEPQFHVCIGINAGPVVAGNIGSIRRMEYTVIGDTVNLAARIKSLSSERRAPILVGESVYEKVKGQFEFDKRLPAAVKGKSGTIAVYRLRHEVMV